MLNPEYAIVKRVFDFVSSLIVIILASPFMALTALAIKLYDGGPVIYKQVRLTKDSPPFEIYKFQYIRVDAKKYGVARLCSGDSDERITP